MKRLTVALTVAFCGMFAGCAQRATQSVSSEPKVTREYLLAHGFKQWKFDPDGYELETTRLVDVLRDLNLSLEQFQPGVNSPLAYDVRFVKLKGWYVDVKSLVSDLGGDTLDKPNTLCRVLVLLNQRPPPVYRKTDSTPEMRIKAVKAMHDPSRPLEVTFELTAKGTTPLGLGSPGQFSLVLVRQGEPVPKLLGIDASFPEATPEHIIVSPGKPITLTLHVSNPPTVRNPITHGPWTDLRPGKYVVSVAIGYQKRQDPYFDYHWVGREFSNEFEFTIK